MPQGESFIDRGREVAMRLIAAGAVVGTLAMAGCSDNELGNDRAATTTEATSTTEATTTTEADVFDENVFTDQLLQRAQGFGPEEIRAGDDVVFGENPREAGAAAFSEGVTFGDGDQVIETNQEIADYLATAGERPQVVKQNIIDAFTAAGRPEEAARALSGEGYIPVQFMTDVAISGTTYFVDGKLVQMQGERLAGKGDVIWVYADEKGNILWDASIRADCSNLRIEMIRPVRPGEPLPPSIEIPPQPGEPVINPKVDRNTSPPGDPNVPADRDHGTPDVPGRGPAGQQPDDRGYVPGERDPITTAPTTEPERPTTTAPRPPATTTPAPVTTNPPVPATTSVPTTAPPTSMPPRP